MIIKQDFLYSPKGANRPLHIYLPDGYETRQERYPVMYFFDGHNLFFDSDATYGKCWGLKDFLDGWGKDMIVVGLECGHDGDERLSEYLPYPADKGSWFDRFVPMGAATMDWIVNEVKPYIDAHFPTIPFRECTGIAGSSMGGVMSLYAAVRYNRCFSKAGCLSSAIGFCMQPLMEDMRRCPISPDTRIYLSWGTREAHGVKDPEAEDKSSWTYRCNNQAADLAVQKGAAVKLRCQVGGAHCEADWEKLVPECMHFLWME